MPEGVFVSILLLTYIGIVLGSASLYVYCQRQSSAQINSLEAGKNFVMNDPEHFVAWLTALAREIEKIDIESLAMSDEQPQSRPNRCCKLLG